MTQRSKKQRRKSSKARLLTLCMTSLAVVYLLYQVYLFTRLFYVRVF